MGRGKWSDVARWLGLTSADRSGGGWFPVVLAGWGLTTLVIVQVVSPETMTRRAWWVPHLFIGIGVVSLLITLRFRRRGPLLRKESEASAERWDLPVAGAFAAFAVLNVFRDKPVLAVLCAGAAGLQLYTWKRRREGTWPPDASPESLARRGLWWAAGSGIAAAAAFGVSIATFARGAGTEGADAARASLLALLGVLLLVSAAAGLRVWRRGPHS